MATERAFALIAASFASLVCHESERNPMVAKIARIVITTMSSASVNQNGDLNFLAVFPAFMRFVCCIGAGLRFADIS